MEIPAQRVVEARRAAEIIGPAAWQRFPWVEGAHPAARDVTDDLLARTWRPSISYTAQDGLPPLSAGGNVLRPSTTLKLSLRFPPTLDAVAATELVKRVLESDPPHGAHVTFTASTPSSGWNAPPTAPWLEAAIDSASRAHFGNPPGAMGEGGTIPFMAMLGERFPGTQFLITGVLGPESNAHGPNEFLHIPCATKLSACVADVITRMP